MKQKLLTSILIMTMTLAGTGNILVSAAEVPDVAYTAAEEADTMEEMKAAEDREMIKEDQAAEEKKETAAEGVTAAEETAEDTQDTPKVKVAETGQVKYDNVNALGEDRVVLEKLPPMF